MIDFNKLKSPFPPEKVSWRVGSITKDKTKAMALAYIDARDVMERLDEVCGPGGWQCKYSHAEGKTICDIGILIERPLNVTGNLQEWVWKADGAGDSDIEAAKGALSDAFKRAAVRWGIGRYLYDVKTPWVKIDEWKHILPEEMKKLEAVLRSEATVTLVPTTLEQRASAFTEYLRKMRTPHAVTNIVATNGKLLFELKEKLPTSYEAISQEINQIQEAFALADAS